MNIYNMFVDYDGMELVYVVAIAYFAVAVLFVVYFWRFTKESFFADLQEREYLLRCNPKGSLPDYLQTVELKIASWVLHHIHKR